MVVKQAISVLHVPYTFFPDQPGGTEVYVAGLVAAMRSHGFDGKVAAPGERECTYEHNGIAVYRFTKTMPATFDHAYGLPDEAAAESFRGVLRQLVPEIVHIHAHTAAVSERIVDAARSVGARVVFTYHTPTVSCLRGTMMLMGRTPCDGVLHVRRCAICTLQKHGVPEWLGNALARMPECVGRTMANAGLAGDVVTGLRMAELAGDVHSRFHSLIAKVDRVVAVCQWVMDALIANGVSASKLVLCRQGFSATGSRPAGTPLRTRRSSGDAPLRLGYFGRLEFPKGLDIIIGAIKRIPSARLTLNIHGIVQPGSENYASQLKSVADGRINFREPLAPDAVPDQMAESDFVVIPSRWLETGPLVAYESFAAGTPILGARIGGIAELVTDGVDGILVDGNDPERWAQVILSVAEDSSRVDRLRRGVRTPRTMTDVADEMATHYRSVISEYA